MVASNKRAPAIPSRRQIPTAVLPRRLSLASPSLGPQRRAGAAPRCPSAIWSARMAAAFLSIAAARQPQLQLTTSSDVTRHDIERCIESHGSFGRPSFPAESRIFPGISAVSHYLNPVRICPAVALPAIYSDLIACINPLVVMHRSVIELPLVGFKRPESLNLPGETRCSGRQNYSGHRWAAFTERASGLRSLQYAHTNLWGKCIGRRDGEGQGQSCVQKFHEGRTISDSSMLPYACSWSLKILSSAR